MSHRFRRLIGLMTIGLGILIGPLDTSVNIAFPYIVDDLNQPMAMIQWVVICYVLTYASLMLIFGKLGDLYGQRRVFAIGLLVSIFSLSLVAISPNFTSLLFFRFLQGLGTGLLTSVAPALVINLYSEEQRAKAVGLFTLIFALGSLFGPIIGGILVEWYDWRAVFWFRIPIALISFLLLFSVPKEVKRIGKPRFDFLGAITLVLALSSFLLTLNQFQRIDQHGITPIICLALFCCFCIVGFLKTEGRAEEPILKLDVFKNIDFALINLASCLLYMVTFSVVLLIPFLLPKISGLSIMASGLILATGFIGTTIAAPLGGRMVAIMRANWVAFCGLAMTGTGLLSISWITNYQNPIWMMAALFLQGVGTGLFQVAYMYLVTGALPFHDRGISGSIAMLTRTIGVVTGVTTITLVFSWLTERYREVTINEEIAFYESFRSAFTLAGGALLVFLIITLLYPRVWIGRSSQSKK